MLRRLGASDHRFRALQFRAGLNILVADTANGSRDTDSRNGAGKSSMIELIHFMLGERSEPKSLPRQAVLQKVEFNLTLDWPRLPEPVTVHRSGERHTWSGCTRHRPGWIRDSSTWGRARSVTPSGNGSSNETCSTSRSSTTASVGATCSPSSSAG